MLLSARYLHRLKLPPTFLTWNGAAAAPLERLQVICAAHLKHIPFENLSQHGVGEAVSLDVDAIAHKILDKRRGGFCFELNSLLAEWLIELGYTVVRVMAHVYKEDIGYVPDPNHMFLIVTLPSMRNDDNNKNNNDDDEHEHYATHGNTTRYLVDVGFAEPAIHPLRYEFNTAQVTPEGMVSRLVTMDDDEQHDNHDDNKNKNDDNANDNVVVVLEWLNVTTGKFVPRFKFKHADATMKDGLQGPTLQDFEANLRTVQHPTSPFSRKVIVCRITETMKMTIAGNRMKITGPPRFADNDDNKNGNDGTTVPVVIKDLGTVDNVRAVLDSDFGIPWDETRGLELTKSLQSPPEMWMY